MQSSLLTAIYVLLLLLSFRRRGHVFPHNRRTVLPYLEDFSVPPNAADVHAKQHAIHASCPNAVEF